MCTVMNHLLENMATCLASYLNSWLSLHLDLLGDYGQREVLGPERGIREVTHFLTGWGSTRSSLKVKNSHVSARYLNSKFKLNKNLIETKIRFKWVCWSPWVRSASVRRLRASAAGTRAPGRRCGGGCRSEFLTKSSILPIQSINVIILIRFVPIL